MRAGSISKPNSAGAKIVRISHLSCSALVDAPFSSVIEYVAEFFDERPHLRVKGFVSADIRVETRNEIVEDTDAVRRHDALALSWKPTWSIFPSFNGQVTVRPRAPGSALALEGSYQPPGGQLGSLFDSLIGQRLARRTMDNLLKRLCRYVERRHRAFQQSCPTVADLNELVRSSDRGFELHDSAGPAPSVQIPTADSAPPFTPYGKQT